MTEPVDAQPMATPKFWDTARPGLTAFNVVAGLVGIAPVVAVLLFLF